jgi:hypothetical protein
VPLHAHVHVCVWVPDGGGGPGGQLWDVCKDGQLAAPPHGTLPIGPAQQLATDMDGPTADVRDACERAWTAYQTATDAVDLAVLHTPRLGKQCAWMGAAVAAAHAHTDRLLQCASAHG